MRASRPALLLAAFLAVVGWLPLAAPVAHAAEGAVVANKSSKVFHAPGCRVAAKLKDANKVDFASVADAEKAGFHGCKVCKPAGATPAATTWVGSEGGDTFHVSTCADAKKIKKKNRRPFASAADATAAGLKPCLKCHPKAP